MSLEPVSGFGVSFFRSVLRFLLDASVPPRLRRPPFPSWLISHDRLANPLHHCYFCRDLKPGNILVESLLQARVKVCDFGLSIVPADADAAQEASVAESTQVFGSPAYAAPELSRPEHTNAVDIFSFGIVLWELWLRTKPWLEYQRSTSIGDAIAAGKRPNSELVMVKTRSAQQKDPASTEKLRTLMIKCWSPAPMSRPTFQYIFLAVSPFGFGMFQLLFIYSVLR